MVIGADPKSADNRKCFGVEDEGSADQIAREVAGEHTASSFVVLEAVRNKRQEEQEGTEKAATSMSAADDLRTPLARWPQRFIPCLLLTRPCSTIEA